MSVTPYTKLSSASLAGLITDGNALIVTEQSNLSESNYEMMRDGTRRRRRPIVEEVSDTSRASDSNGESPVSTYLWKTPAFEDNLSILCQEQQGEILFFKIDHDNPQPVRSNEYDDSLLLSLWGSVELHQRRGPDDYIIYGGRESTIRKPCTYTEGNGSLYVFNNVHGCIRVDLIDDRLQMTPIGTWVRDYEPPIVSEESSDSTDIRRIGYDLSNIGWDRKSISSLGRIPSLTQRPVDGRLVGPDGIDSFSVEQFDNAPERGDVSPNGARIGDSRFYAAGTLSNSPISVTPANINITNDGTSRLVEIDLPNDYANDSNSALFIHSFTFNADNGGKVYQGGYAGIQLHARKGSGETGGGGGVGAFRLAGGSLGEFGNIEPTEVQLYLSPTDWPDINIQNTKAWSKVNGGPTSQAGAYFAGRLWRTADVHNRLYYSQVITTGTGPKQNRGIGKESMCFAYRSPTNPDDNAVVDTDGGYVNMSDSGTHYGLVQLGDSLILMTDRGIWAVRPGTQGVFTASNYQVVKVHGSEVLGPKAFVSTGDMLQVATDEGILSLAMESTSFGNTSVVVTKMLDQKLMNTYEDIVREWPLPQAAYDPETRIVRWVFSPELGETENMRNKSQPILNYTMYHDAWFKYDMGTEGSILSMFVLPYTAQGKTYNRFRYLIASLAPNDDTVRTQWGVEEDYDKFGIALWVEGGISTQERFSDYRRRDYHNSFRDPVPAHMLTNHNSPGNGMNWSQIKYLIIHNRNVTKSFVSDPEFPNGLRPSVDGGTLLSVRWDWMDQQTTGKWSYPYQTYRYRRSYLMQGGTEDNTLGEPVLVHKMKLRGRGREFRLYFESDGHKDSHIEGWAYQGYILNEV